MWITLSLIFWICELYLYGKPLTLKINYIDLCSFKKPKTLTLLVLCIKPLKPTNHLTVSKDLENYDLMFSTINFFSLVLILSNSYYMEKPFFNKNQLYWPMLFQKAPDIVPFSSLLHGKPLTIKLLLLFFHLNISEKTNISTYWTLLSSPSVASPLFCLMQNLSFRDIRTKMLFSFNIIQVIGIKLFVIGIIGLANIAVYTVFF